MRPSSCEAILKAVGWHYAIAPTKQRPSYCFQLVSEPRWAVQSVFRPIFLQLLWTQQHWPLFSRVIALRPDPCIGTVAAQWEPDGTVTWRETEESEWITSYQFCFGQLITSEKTYFQLDIMTWTRQNLSDVASKLYTHILQLISIKTGHSGSGWRSSREIALFQLFVPL